MLNTDNNDYISKIYNKSVDLHHYVNYGSREQDEQNNEEEQYEEDGDMDNYDRLRYKCETEAKVYNKTVYKDIKAMKACDVYIYEQDAKYENKVLTHEEKYIPYHRREQLREAINAIMTYQENSNSIDYHPNINDLSGDIKTIVDNEMAHQQRRWYQNNEVEKAPQNTVGVVKIRNIIHQSLQPYNKLFAKSTQEASISEYFKKQKENTGLDQWGKLNKVSPSEFLWLPAQFKLSQETCLYEIQGKLFHPLEDCPALPQLKEELNHLMTYFSTALYDVHDHFGQIDYDLKLDYSYYNNNAQQVEQNKMKLDFYENIHAIVKITEMEIQPGCTYSGQWHVEGFSSDNILYTCLYVLEQDENLVEGKLKFKRTPRSDDIPTNGRRQEQCAHSYCPNYEYLCDTHKLIPLGSLDIKENLMIIFPNQNIHKVKGIKNTTDKPLKRKIVVFFIVNHWDQPFTINDVEFTQPLEVIKQNRLRDMYERSKNKQTDSQAFNYCEH